MGDAGRRADQGNTEGANLSYTPEHEDQRKRGAKFLAPLFLFDEIFPSQFHQSVAEIDELAGSDYSDDRDPIVLAREPAIFCSSLIRNS